jgi:hypothetical protein
MTARWDEVPDGGKFGFPRSRARGQALHCAPMQSDALRSTLKAALIGGLIAGSLDLSYAFVVWQLRGVPPERVLRGIAAGVLGRDALAGGVWVPALGAFLHYFIACAAAAFYLRASLMFPVLRDRAVVCGIAYGGAFYLLMTFVIVPLSAAPGTPGVNWGGLFAHTILFGLPIALVARQVSRRMRKVVYVNGAATPTDA